MSSHEPSVEPLPMHKLSSSMPSVAPSDAAASSNKSVDCSPPIKRADTASVAVTGSHNGYRRGTKHATETDGKYPVSRSALLQGLLSVASRRRHGYSVVQKSASASKAVRWGSVDDSNNEHEMAALAPAPPVPAEVSESTSRPRSLPIQQPMIVPQIEVLQASPPRNAAIRASCTSLVASPVGIPLPFSATRRRSLKATLSDTTAFINNVARRLQPMASKSTPTVAECTEADESQAGTSGNPEVDPATANADGISAVTGQTDGQLPTGTASTPAENKSGFWKQQILALFQPSDNKLAMKLFGTKTALLKEKSRQCETGHFIVHPCSPFRYYWDFVMLIMLITTMLASPVSIAFFNDVDEIGWVIYNCFCDSCFLMDIIVNFRTGIILNDSADEVILDPHTIAVHYVKSWFFLDLLSSMPLDYIFLLIDVDSHTANMGQLVHAGRALRILRLAKLLSLLRLLRVSRLVRYVNEWEEFLNIATVVVRVLNLTFLILLLGHWDACLQFLVPMLRDFPPDSWPAIEELVGKSWLEQYTWSLFRALSHMLCIGYGRFPPQNQTDTWLTMTSMMCGAICYAMFVGHVTALIQSFDTAKRLYREKFKQVEEYMTFRKLPRPLRQRISNYYEHRYQGRMFDETSIMEELSDCLRQEILNYNCRPLVEAVPFLKHADPNFVSAIVTRLEFEVFQPGDLVIKVDTYGDKMYFIQEGIIDVISRSNETVTSLSDGSYFGEICLLADTKRVATIRAETYCYMYSLKRDHFVGVLNEFPVMRRTIESIAAERLAQIGCDPTIVSRRPDLNEDLEAVKELVQKVVALENEQCSESDENWNRSDERLPEKKRSKKKHHHYRSFIGPVLSKSRSQNFGAETEEVTRGSKVGKSYSMHKANKYHLRRKSRHRSEVESNSTKSESDDEPKSSRLGVLGKKHKIGSVEILANARSSLKSNHSVREALINSLGLSQCIAPAQHGSQPSSTKSTKRDNNFSISCQDVSISFDDSK